MHDISSGKEYKLSTLLEFSDDIGMIASVKIIPYCSLFECRHAHTEMQASPTKLKYLF